MDWYKSYNLVKNSDGYDLVVYLNPNCTEFSKELAANFKENILDMDEQIREFVKERFSDVKIHTVKLVLGTLAVATMPFMTLSKAHAEELTPSSTQQNASSSLISLNTTGVVTALKLNVRQGPSTNYSRIHYLWKGNKVKVTGQLGNWYQIKLSDGRVGWVSKTFLKVDTRQERINKVVATGRSLVGTPYVWGGESLQEGGFDCSGFTQYVFNKAGYELPRVSSDQAKYGTLVSRLTLQPGDLVFYSMQANGVVSHVGLYIGNGQMIHSPKPGDAVKITNITTSYWENRFITARRII
jgi:cell wall-associated NlpC family hydrolase